MPGTETRMPGEPWSTGLRAPYTPCPSDTCSLPRGLGSAAASQSCAALRSPEPRPLGFSSCQASALPRHLQSQGVFGKQPGLGQGPCPEHPCRPGRGPRSAFLGEAQQERTDHTALVSLPALRQPSARCPGTTRPARPGGAWAAATLMGAAVRMVTADGESAVTMKPSPV